MKVLALNISNSTSLKSYQIDLTNNARVHTISSSTLKLICFIGGIYGFGSSPTIFLMLFVLS